MNEIISKYLMSEISTSNDQITMLENRINQFASEEGAHLAIYNRRGTNRFYKVKDDGNRKYLSQKNDEELSKYLQNYYDLRVICKLREWNKTCTTMHEALINHDNFHEDIPPWIIAKVVPIAINSDKFAKDWESGGRRHNTGDDFFQIQTLRGDYVRSKSEALIANTLFLAGLHYRYEDPLQVGKITYHPDFQIMHPLTCEIFYWEHFGKIDDPEYAQKLVDKIESYAEIGIISGLNFTTTYECYNKPLSMLTVNRNIELLFGVKVNIPDTQ